MDNDNLITIDRRELERLQSVETAWSAVFFALQAGNDRTFQRPQTGKECAVREIERLQFIAGCYEAAKAALAAETAKGA